MRTLFLVVVLVWACHSLGLAEPRRSPLFDESALEAMRDRLTELNTAHSYPDLPAGPEKNAYVDMLAVITQTKDELGALAHYLQLHSLFRAEKEMSPAADFLAARFAALHAELDAKITRNLELLASNDDKVHEKRLKRLSDALRMILTELKRELRSMKSDLEKR